MALHAFLSHLRRSAVQLWLDEGQLKFRAPKGALSVEDMDTLRVNRESIIALLRDRSSAGSVPMLRAVGRDLPVPLSPVQERLWLIHSRDESPAYNLHGALSLQGPLAIAQLQAAFAALTARHEILRTRFSVAKDSDLPTQRIHPAGPPAFQVIEVSENEREAVLEQHASVLFDLQEGPLLQVLLLRVSAQSHVISVVMHHIIADGWSFRLFVQELQALYAGQTLAPLTIQYADYAHWQRQRDNGPSLDYWTRQLQGYRTPLDLSAAGTPLGEPGPAASLNKHLPPALCEQLGQLSQRQGSSLFSLFIAALAVVAHRQTGREDLCLGTTVAGRDEPALEPLIGFFINILPLRLDLSGNPTVMQLLERSSDTLLSALDHRGPAFEQIIQALPELRQAHGHSVVPVMVRHQNYPAADLDHWSPGLSVRNQSSTVTRPAQTDLDLEIFGDARGLELSVTFDSQRFSQRQIELLLDTLETVLQRFTREPLARLKSFCEPTATERALFARSNATQQTFKTSSVIQMFSQQVQQRSDALACVDDNHRLSYFELDRLATQIAQGLFQRGVRHQARVVLHMPRSTHYLAALLAIWKLGGVYVPLDPGYPQAYLRRALEDVEPTVVLTQTDLAECRFPVWHLGTEPLPDFAELPIEPALPEDLAYIAYTSGSTGEPKGVMVEHRQLLNCLQSLWQYLPFQEDEVVGQRTSAAFVPAIKELLAGLLAGVAQVILSDLLVRDTPALANALQQHGITRLNLVPSQLAVLLEHSGQLGRLRHVTTAGEPLGQELVQRFVQRLPHAQLHNNYGCSELNDICYSSADGLTHTSTVAPIGYPIANVRLHVLDEYLDEVPVLTAGSLYVEGPNVGPGYWQRPDLSAERFIYHRGKRFMHTGDQAQWLPDGRLQLLGREDFQLKIRGQRVELPAVELALASHPQIKKAAVIGQYPGTADARLVAFYVTEAGAEVDANQLRAWLLEQLPGAMVPSRFEAISTLPVLPNGKLDRRALQHVPLSVNAGMQQRHEPPQGDIENALADIWSRLLEIEHIGRQDNFFALGGQSLQASQVIARIRKQLNVELPIRCVFESLSLQALALAVTAASTNSLRQASSASLVGHNTGGSQRPLFLAHTLFGSSAYVQSLAEYLNPDLPVYALPALSLGARQLEHLPHMAERFVGLIRQIQPHGPYRLGGWSYGGLLAYETATALQARGESVEFVGTLDSTLPAHCSGNLSVLPSRERFSMEMLYTFVFENFTDFDAQNSPLARLTSVPDLLEGLLDEIELRRQHDQPLWYLSYGSRAENRQFFDRLLAHGNALFDWRARPASLPVHVFKARDISHTPTSGHEQDLPALGWECLLPAEQLKVIPVEGTHRTMMREYIRELAAQLDDAIGLPLTSPWQTGVHLP